MNKVITILSFCFLLFVSPGVVLFAQTEGPESVVEEAEEERKILQFSGIVLNADTVSYLEVEPIFYCHIYIKNSGRGTTSNLDGLFSIVAHTGDTILFSALGHKPNYIVIPDSIDRKVYSIIHLMEVDTFTLAEAVIYPWPTREKFKDSFMALDINDDPIAQYDKAFGREIPYDYVPQRNENSIGPAVVITGPITAIADFIRDGKERKMNRYRRRLGILDSVKTEQGQIQPGKSTLEQLLDAFPQGLKDAFIKDQ